VSGSDTDPSAEHGKPATKRVKPFYRQLWGQVLIAVVAAIAVGWISPQTGIAMRPLGDGFIRLITMIITLIVFCTIVSGIAGMQDLKKVGRVGGKALIYFEVLSSLALVMGLIAGNVVKPGAGFNADPAALNAGAVGQFATQAQSRTVLDFLLNIIPTTVVSAFATGSMLQVVLVAILFGIALSSVGKHAKPLVDLIHSLTQAIFAIVNLIMKFAPIGVFGAMAFTVGQYGISSLGPLAKLMVAFSVLSLFFLFVVLGLVCWMAGFSIIRFLSYIREEIVVVLATASSEPVLPSLMAKLEKLGCSEGLVGLVVPTGYTFNTDGSCLYITMAALFVAQATNTDLTITQQITLCAVAALTSKGAGGVYGSSFIALVGTLQVIPTIPVAGMALILGIDRFFSLFRATINMIGNGVAALVVARWERELDSETLRRNLVKTAVH
jgi:aerobic C4-dicarboxylate transport protein